jgi:hypothetical protein
LITIKELCKYDLAQLPLEHQWNIQYVYHGINLFRAFYQLPMISTSGYRTVEDQKRIYQNEAHVPMGSLHLVGLAVDIYCGDNRLKDFIRDNMPLVNRLDFYFEEYDDRPRIHFQRHPPASGKRFFKPF